MSRKTEQSAVGVMDQPLLENRVENATRGVQNRQTDDPARTFRVPGHIADDAIRLGQSPPDAPANFILQREIIVRGFAQVAAGQDEEARTSLQQIGLKSSFLEWKLLLRGFLAFYQHDDARALENWQRLTPERLPAQLASPNRMAIDPAFKSSLPPKACARLEQTLTEARNDDLIARLELIRRHICDQRKLPQAFRYAEQVLTRLKNESPNLVPRLAGCFFWAVVDHGNPEDLKRYLRVFGPPPEDPELHRLEALALEDRGYAEDAHEAWQKYEKSLGIRASTLPPDHADRMRALVWKRMGNNAARSLAESSRRRHRAGSFPFLDDDDSRPLKPNAETCYRRSLALAPDQLETHATLVQFYLNKKQASKALTACQKLLKKFPDHAHTLELVGDLNMLKGRHADAVRHFSSAVRANPLDARLRDKLATAYALSAQSHAIAKEFDQARQGFQAALALRNARQLYAVLCPWAACEFLADDSSRAETLLAQAREDGPHALAISFSMLVHCVQFKLGKTFKTRFEAEVNEMLSAKPDPDSAAAIAAQAGALHMTGMSYVGQKVLEKKVLTYLDKAKKLKFKDEQLKTICETLVILDSRLLLRSYFTQGQKRFRRNPHFYLAEVDYQLSLGEYRTLQWRVSLLLDKIRDLASALSQEERDRLMLAVQQREEKFRELFPFGGFLGGFSLDDFFDDGEI